MKLTEEIQADLYSGELDDLFQPVEWGYHILKAMVETAATIEGMDDLGGTVLRGERQFKFRRRDLVEIDEDFEMIGDVIHFAGRVYDVMEIEDRPDHPIVIVRGDLRA